MKRFVSCATLITATLLALLPKITVAQEQSGQEAKPIPPIGKKTLAVNVVPALGGRLFGRPVLITHAGDGSGRLFVAGQRGKVHAFAKDDEDAEPSLFLDMSHKCRFHERQFEEGLIGLTFHPQFAENGQLFVYYSSTEFDYPHMSVISRMHVSAEDPNRVDLDSEEVLLTLKQPYWNHNGGTLLFGPDGYLYIAFGDGGAANDPHSNGQNLGTLFGSILRIDVNSSEGDRAYAIPPDNPFIDRQGARPEIWAYGLRNVWRMAFDRKTNLLWAGDVGQDLWEEVDIIERGGNYGWNLREGSHPFGKNGAGPREDLIDPVFEYHHDSGKSITGGCVYRGKRVPELVGKYLFADFVTGELCALDYDAEQKELRDVYTIPWQNFNIMTFGESEDGEVYLGEKTLGGVYRLEPAS